LLQKKGLVVRLTGSGRVERWRHLAYEAWKVGKVELAILGELLLRGAQTEGELRGRASRMEPIEDLDQLRAVLKPMAERRLIVYLTPEGRRGTVLTHGFLSPSELDAEKARHLGGSQEEAPSPIPATANSRPSTELAEAWQEIAELRQGQDRLQQRVDELAYELSALKASLGA
jgi:uncharacterized protein YceH (UPF0502 family)